VFFEKDCKSGKLFTAMTVNSELIMYTEWFIRMVVNTLDRPSILGGVTTRQHE